MCVGMEPFPGPGQPISGHLDKESDSSSPSSLQLPTAPQGEGVSGGSPLPFGLHHMWGNHFYLYLLHFQNVTKLEVNIILPFQTDFFNFIMNILTSSMSCHSLLAYFPFVMNNTILPCIAVPHSPFNLLSCVSVFHNYR